MCFVTGELKPLLKKGISEQCFLISVILFLLLFVFLSFGLLVWYYLFSVFSWVYLIFPGLNFPSITFCRTRFVDRFCLNLVLSWDVLFSPSIVTESFAEYSSLDCGLLHPVAHLSRPFSLLEYPVRSQI